VSGALESQREGVAAAYGAIPLVFMHDFSQFKAAAGTNQRAIERFDDSNHVHDLLSRLHGVKPPDAARQTNSWVWADLTDRQRAVTRVSNEPYSQDVACQRDGTTSLPRAWDHLGLSVSMLGLARFVNGDTLALPVGGALDDEGVRA